MGDFNARIGRDHLTWGEVIGKHLIGKLNSNGLRLLALCAEHKLFVTNTAFQQKNKYKASWMHPRSRHWHLLDYIIVRRDDLRDIHHTRAMRGAECWTDHRLILSKMKIVIRHPVKKQAPAPRLNVARTRNPEVKAKLRSCVAEQLSKIPEEVESVAETTEEAHRVEGKWDFFRNAVRKAAEDSLGFTRKRQPDWFGENADEVLELIAAKRKAHDAHLASGSMDATNRWHQLRAETQRTLRRLQNDWWTQKSREIQHLADTGDMHNF